MSRLPLRFMFVWTLSASLTGVAWGQSVKPLPAVWTLEDAAHLMRRAGFGGTPEQIAQLHAIGRQAAVDYLVFGPPRSITGEVRESAPADYSAVPTVFHPAELPEFLASVDLDFADVRRLAMRAFGRDDSRAERTRKQLIALQRFTVAELRGWWLDRMARSDYPLEEKMILFWHGLFTSSEETVRNAELLVMQHMEQRKQAVGNYKHLTLAMVQDPAMLQYLDNDQNTKAEPNENLARELFELFTLGEGNYTEQDVREAARCLTGAGIYQGEFFFRHRQHDSGSKTVFGRRGTFGPSDLVGVIFSRREPAWHLARRLFVFFVHPDPSPEELEPIAQALRENRWELKPALRVLFNSESFYSEKAKFTIVKSPVELFAGTARLLQNPPPPSVLLLSHQHMKEMGQELFKPPNVRGWPGGDLWISSTTLNARYALANYLVNGELRGRAARLAGIRGLLDRSGMMGTEDDAGDPLLRELNTTMEKVSSKLESAAAYADTPAIKPKRLFADALGTVSPSPEQLVDHAIKHFLQRPLHPDKRQALLDVLGGKALVLGQDDTDRRVRKMVTLLLSTPEYQVQ